MATLLRPRVWLSGLGCWSLGSDCRRPLHAFVVRVSCHVDEVACGTDAMPLPPLSCRAETQVLGKLLMEHSVAPYQLSLPILKHLLGLPLCFSDLEFSDAELYRNLCWLRANAGAGGLGLDFTVTRESFGVKEVVELIPGGRDTNVTDANKEEFLKVRIWGYLSCTVFEAWDPGSPRWLLVVDRRRDCRRRGRFRCSALCSCVRAGGVASEVYAPSAATAPKKMIDVGFPVCWACLLESMRRFGVNALE